MTVCPRSLLLGLLILLYLQTCVEGQDVKAPEECCFKFNIRQIPATNITKYENTSSNCPKPGVVFTTKKGRVCVDPRSRWVKRVIGTIDRRPVKSSASTTPIDKQASEEQCCSVLVALLPKTGIYIPDPGVLFSIPKGPVCMDPSSWWAKLVMDIIDGRYVKSSAATTPIDKQASEEQCCSFLVALLKKTGTYIPDPGVLYITTKGPVCMDPSSWWVKRAMGIIDGRSVESSAATTPIDKQASEEQCCSVLVALLKKLGTYIPDPEELFSIPKGPVCMDPSSWWLKRVMGIIDGRSVESSAATTPIDKQASGEQCCSFLVALLKKLGTYIPDPGVLLKDSKKIYMIQKYQPSDFIDFYNKYNILFDKIMAEDGLTPESCCFRFYTRSIPVAEIIQYKETGVDCEKTGEMFSVLYEKSSQGWINRSPEAESLITDC